MPPKKKEDLNVVLDTLWGRPGTTLKMGIVGLPNVGKSTTFNLMSKLNVPASNYSFCTVEPNLARVNIPDDRLDKLADVFQTKSKQQATLQIVDIAGLVRGAASGAGLGNQFLSHIKEADGIYHVVRAFEDDEITHEENSVDPVRDMEIIRDELIAKDLEFIEKRMREMEVVIKKGNLESKTAEINRNLLILAKENLQKKIWVRCIKGLTHKDIEQFNQYSLITAKPVVYLINLSEKDYIRKQNKFLPAIVKWIKENIPGVFIPFSAEFEQKCVLNPIKKEDDDKILVAQEVIKNINGVQSQIANIIKQGFKNLDLIYFFTAGIPECKCWTVKKYSKAPVAGGRIHGDFEQGFICAEVMKYDDFISLDCNQGKVKEAGKLRQQGKEYVVEDGDIINFRFNVSKPKK